METLRAHRGTALSAGVRVALLLLLLPGEPAAGAGAWSEALVRVSDPLAARLEAYLPRVGPVLRARSLEHYALLWEPSQADVLRVTAPVSFRPDGDAYVLGVGDVVEHHGGGILSLLFAQWRPHGRPAGLQDRFAFLPNRRQVALGALYEGHKRQLVLPPSASEGLPRMRFFGAEPEVAAVERDAWAFLQLLVAHESDFSASWETHQGLRLSVDGLLRRARDTYLRERGPESERADHSFLHLVEILLFYERARARSPGAAERFDPGSLQERFLATELSRPDADDEALGHYAESLAFLLAEPALCWQASARQQVEGWLARLDARFPDLGAAEPRHLAHLLHGLRLLRATTPPACGSSEPAASRGAGRRAARVVGVGDRG